MPASDSDSLRTKNGLFGRVRAHEDLEHPQGWVALERAILVREAPPGVHHQKMLGIGDELAVRRLTWRIALGKAGCCSSRATPRSPM